MRIPLCCVLALGCGYESYYPTPTSRSQGDLSLLDDGGDGGGGGTEEVCTDPTGYETGESVAVTFYARAPVQVVEIYDDCTIGGTIPLHETGATWTLTTWAGQAYRVETPEAVLLYYLQVPFGTGGDWYAEVP